MTRLHLFADDRVRVGIKTEFKQRYVNKRNGRARRESTAIPGPWTGRYAHAVASGNRNER
jgi:hypothetical protein